MRVERYEKSDYPIIQKWVNQIQWEVLEEDLIPPASFIAYQGESPIAFGCCYMGEGCGFSKIGTFLVDQEASREDIKEGVLAVFERIKQEVQESGRDVIYYTTNNRFLIKCAKSVGLKPADLNATAMVMSITGKLDTDFFEADDE